MNTITKYLALAAAAVMILSCSKLKDIEDRIDILESRIQAIESIIPSLNSNIETLKALAAGGTINNVEEVDGKYKITLSNGEVYYLTQGSYGSAPTMSIDTDGYWMADYHDGFGPVYVLCNGEKVKAFGDNGITPAFGVDSEGYWTVSYDGKATWQQVKNYDGQPVTALPEGDSKIFTEAILTDTSFTVTLADGSKVSLPIVPDFVFIINAPNEVINFKEGEAKSYTIISEGVATASIVAVPDGFRAILSDDAIMIQALFDTKAYADTTTDIAVLALSEEGYGLMRKIRVKKIK